MHPFPSWLSAMLPGVRRSMIEVGHATLHVMEMGPETAQPVVCLHGNPSWGFLYRKVAHELDGSHLGGAFRVVMPDLVGLGFSTKPPASAHTLDEHARWIRGVIESLDLRDAIFVGQDWGGAIGLLAFAGCPDRLSAMVILNTVVGPPREGFRPTAFHRFAQMPFLAEAAFRFGGFPQNVMALAQGDRSSIRGEVARAYRYPLRRLRDRAGPLALARMVPDAANHPSIEPLQRSQAFFESFDGPIEIVWGDRDPVLGPSVRRWIHKLRPDANVTQSRAGHFLQEEVPAEIARAISATQFRGQGH